ncbi:P-loop nucleotide/nucleoside kinase family protein [Gracilibacillus alcaliphilus]|uniref:AAA family ATPase n=1 Tax=Gracilibacillus alcaliphilus TaxID=1401441 RepID=UPI00195E5C23|nr:AAA family ATPase [Gracilibacillus alcaliphilus]MBM7676211.1 deoxyadenosine/deoxycytidine kinase [Gracilibacillus alcaliphilus]
MIIWLNGAFGSGKTTCAYELQRRLQDSFVYDPENLGFFLRDNLPEQMKKSDFQDYPEWRKINYQLLYSLANEYEGTIIVPMTLIKQQYYQEIIERLAEQGIKIKHFIIHAQKSTLIKRLNKRLEFGNSWGKQKIDQCIYAFEHEICQEKIITDQQTIDQVVEEIAKRAGVKLLPDHRNQLRKRLDRIQTQWQHIR